MAANNGSTTSRTVPSGNFPVDCLNVHAEQTGIRTLPVEVTEALSQDVTYRLKEIIHNALQFMGHANRQTLRVDDVNRALKWSDVQPVVGLSSCHASPGLRSVNGGSVCTVQDEQLSLETAQFNTPSVKKPTLQGSWLCLEGDVLDSSAISVKYERNPIECEEKYLHLLTEAIQGDNEDIRRTAFIDIRTSGSVTAVLPELVQFVLNSVDSRYHLNALQLHRAIRTLLAVMGNSNLYVEPYAPQVVESMLLVALEPVVYKSQERMTHWMVRDLAAFCLAEYLKNIVRSRTKLQEEVQAKLQEQLGLSILNLGSAFGAVSIACYLGKQVVLESVLPNLTKLHDQIESMLVSSSDDMRMSATKLHGVLLVASQISVISDSKKEPNKSLPCQPSCDMDMDTGTSLGPPTPDTTSDIYKTLYELYGEKFGSRLITLGSSQNTGTSRGRREDAVFKSDDTKPSGSTAAVVGESSHHQSGGFRGGPQRVEVANCKAPFSNKPVVQFSCKPPVIKQVNPWNILDPDTYEMYVRQQQMLRQHLQKQKVAKGRVGTLELSKESLKGEKPANKKHGHDLHPHTAWL